MKRASVNFYQSPSSVEDKARDGVKYQILLQEYLGLQKEFVSKKKKLQAARQKRDTLIAELRFLKHRRRYLLKIRSPKIEPKTSVIERKTLERTGAGASASEAILQNHVPILVSNSNGIEEEEKGGQEHEVRKELGIMKSKNCLIDSKAVGKKKILWQDSRPLKV